MGQIRQRLLLGESLLVKFPLPLALGISQRAIGDVSNTKQIFFSFNTSEAEDSSKSLFEPKPCLLFQFIL